MEQVFVVRRADFFAGRWPQGFVPLTAAAGRELLDRLAARGHFMPRDAAEVDPTHKQPIPYCVLRAPDALFCVRREPAQAERRLHGKWSIGIGGHVNPEPAADRRLGDATAGPRAAVGELPDRRADRPAPLAPDVGPFDRGLLQRALRRELAEELVGVDGRAPRARFVGLLNDDGNAVGQVHVGLVHVIDWPTLAAARSGVAIRETAKMSGDWRSLAGMRDLWQDPARLETWSRSLLEAGLAGASAVPWQGNPG